MRVTIEADNTNGKLLAYLRRHGQVAEETFVDGQVRIDVSLPPGEVQRVTSLGGRLRDAESTSEPVPDG